MCRGGRTTGCFSTAFLLGGALDDDDDAGQMALCYGGNPCELSPPIVRRNGEKAPQHTRLEWGIPASKAYISSVIWIPGNVPGASEMDLAMPCTLGTANR